MWCFYYCVGYHVTRDKFVASNLTNAQCCDVTRSCQFFTVIKVIVQEAKIVTGFPLLIKKKALLQFYLV